MVFRERNNTPLCVHLLILNLFIDFCFVSLPSSRLSLHFIILITCYWLLDFINFAEFISFACLGYENAVCIT